MKCYACHELLLHVIGKAARTADTSLKDPESQHTYIGIIIAVFR